MTPLRRVLAAIGIAALLGTAACHGNIPGCAEDDPCWDCSTMGNHSCGLPGTG